MTDPKTILAVDLGGTKILVGEVQKDGKIIATAKYPSDVSTQTSAYQGIHQAIASYLSTAKNPDRIIGISISAVGRINTQTAEWYEIDPSKQEDLSLAALLKKDFQLPIIAGNDVFCATKVELALGIGNVTNNFIYLNIGTGIAGRLVTNRQIINGAHFDAGEIGHMVIDSSSKIRCECGRYGCIEPLASGLGMSNRAKELLVTHPDSTLKVESNGRIPASELFAAFQKDDVATIVVTNALRGIANLIINLVRISDPDAVILGGGVTTSGWLLKHLAPYLNDQAMRFVKYGVRNSQLDPNLIAFRGAAIHGFEQLEVK